MLTSNNFSFCAVASSRTWVTVCLLPLLLLSLICLELISPEPAFADTETRFIDGLGPDSVVALGDWDDDGDLDLAGGSPLKLFENEGGNFTLKWTSPMARKVVAVAWGDWDGDGDLDLADVERASDWSYQTVVLYRNTENGLSPIADLATTTWPTSIAWADWDNDGDLDLGVSNYEYYDSEFNTTVDGYLQVFQNDMGSFSLVWQSESSMNGTDVAWADWDRDGDQDLAISDYWGTNQVYENVGNSLELAWSAPTAYDPVWGSVLERKTRSVAWADWDNDGDLDLAFGNDRTSDTDATAGVSDGSTVVYQNINGHLVEFWSGDADIATTDIVWVDWDGNGYLDLLTGNYGGYGRFDLEGHGNRLYFNTGTSFEFGWDSTEAERTFSIVAGDIDNDGDADIVSGNQIYVNVLTQATRFREILRTPMSGFDSIWSIEWGDSDNDGDLDLAVAADSGLYLYENSGGSLQSVGQYVNDQGVTSVAWGDLDANGFLELAVGNREGELNLMKHDESGLTAFSSPLQLGNGRIRDIALGDMDNDGDLDLAVGISSDWSDNGGGLRILINQGNGFTVCWTTIEDKHTNSVAWGDWDNDGDLDLAVGNGYEGQFLGGGYDGVPENNFVFENPGRWVDPLDCAFELAWISPDTYITSSVDWGDRDGDGDLDLATGNHRSYDGFPLDDLLLGEVNQIFDNEEGSLNLAWAPQNDRNSTVALSWMDWDHDGTSELISVNQDDIQLYENNWGIPVTIARSALFSWLYAHTWGDWNRDGLVDLAIVSGHGWGPASWSILQNSDACFALPYSNYGGSILWPIGGSGGAPHYAVSERAANEIIAIPFQIVGADRTPIRKVQGWYSLNGGGQWFPAVAVDTPLTYLAPNQEYVFKWDTLKSGFFGQSDNVVFRLDLFGGVGPFPFAKRTIYSMPFRVRGTQVRVIDSAGNGTPEAVVYRLQPDQLQVDELIGTSTRVFKTDGQGYLQGYGTLGLGDRLLALAPVEVTDTYTLYHTSGSPVRSGLDVHDISEAGVQTLRVSPENPLLIFDMDVSLEWDASNDEIFVAQLQQNLIKASKALYDWTNGQVALGKVHLYHAKEHWADADIRVYASNQVRPVAHRGGVVADETRLIAPSLSEPIIATRGEIRIGPTWNRYGGIESIADDWPRVLAHELGHYLLFLEDTYLKIDEATGLLIAAQGCDGTAMTDPYDEISSELRYDDGNWYQQCGDTLAELPDWDLISLAYPALKTPPPTNDGPETMPFLFTTVQVHDAPMPTSPLIGDPLVQLDGSSDKLQESSAYLIRPGQQLVDLGRPVIDSILARGAQEGDEVCAIGPQWMGCTSLSNSGPAQFVTAETWMPSISFTPVNSTTLQLVVQDSSNSSFTVSIYPADGEPQTAIVYRGTRYTFTFQTPTVEAMLDIVGNTTRQRTITGYTVGQGPGRARSHGGPGRARSHGGPFTSGDGRVLLYPPTNAPPDMFMVLQSAVSMPPLPAGREVVGRAYQVYSNRPSSDFAGASISFQYHEIDVQLSGQPERNLTVYFWTGTTWTALHTERDLTQNFASASLPGPGLYALMSAVEIPLTGPGWNNIAYTVDETRPVADALASVAGAYTLVYGYDSEDLNDPWKLYSVNGPSWLNQLGYLEFGHAYWIYATEDITLYLPDVSGVSSAQAETAGTPPAAIYGWVIPQTGFSPAPGTAVRAYIDGIPCGSGVITRIGSNLAYVVDVFSDGFGTNAGCGRPGAMVSMVINGVQAAEPVAWDNTRLTELTLRGTINSIGGEQRTLYLPAILK